MYEQEPMRVRTPRRNEVLGIIEAMLGANKLSVRCQDNKIRICRIPGRLRKREWMNEGDVVLVEPWSIQGDKSGDVLMRYTKTQASWLRRKGILNLEV
jgi:translation initiation factor 1A